MPTIELTKDNFEQVVLSNDIVVIDFWAPWCAPCKSFAPVFAKAADNNPAMVFGRVNTDEQAELAALFEVRSIPTLIVFREQIGIFAQAGALPAPVLDEVLQQVLQLDMKEVRRKIAEAEAQAREQPSTGDDASAN